MIDKFWYQQNPNWLSLCLKPISVIFSKIAAIRRSKQQQNQYKSNLTVIVVGNICIGGTGKTPTVIKLAQQFLNRGKKPVIISRGYGGKAQKYPLVVNDKTSTSVCGDEPVMLYDALSGDVPVIVGPQRVKSIKYVEDNLTDIDIVICDDGLQHYKLARDYEMIVVDASRMFGNQLCLPAGPLREPIDRLKSANCVLVIGQPNNQNQQFIRSYNNNVISANIIAIAFVNIKSKQKISVEKSLNQDVVAIAGIGNPDKFFTTLTNNNIRIKNKKVFSDHHNFNQHDFIDIDDSQTVIMTHKDAVKCKAFAKKSWWYLDIDLNISQTDLELILSMPN